MERGDWEGYWSSQKTPLHASADEQFYSRLSDEISYYIGDHRGKRVLELGCGDGVLFGDKAKECESYTGVDFSKSLISNFREKNDRVNLVISDILSFMRNCAEKYDVIFSYGVIQYLNSSELKEVFDLQTRLLISDGLCVHFGIPVKELETPFHGGYGSTEAVMNNLHRGILRKIKSRLFNKIGNWRRFRELMSLSSESGFSAGIYPNMAYFYRVNLVQRIKHRTR